jgi:DnaJ family protein A protein 2
VSLLDFFSGSKKKLMVNSSVICKVCKGKGGGDVSQKCNACKGEGKTYLNRSISPNMFQRIVSNCESCKGSGSLPLIKCKSCNGIGTNNVKKPMFVIIQAGMTHGSRMRIQGGSENGDLIVVLEQIDDEIFTRDGDDLICNHSISISEALCGFKHTLVTIDNKNLLLDSVQIVHDNEMVLIKNYGMPILNTKNKDVSRGNLIVRFQIQYPSTLSIHQITALTSAFPIISTNTAGSIHVNMTKHETSKNSNYQKDPPSMNDASNCATQ